MRKIILFLGDTIMFVLAGFAMLLLRFGIHVSSPIIEAHIQAFIALYVLWQIILYICNLYDFEFIKPSFESIRNLLLAISISLVSGFLLFYFVHFPVTPKTNLLLLALSYGVLLFAWRNIYFSIFAHNFKKHIAFIGNAPLANTLIEEIGRHPHLGYAYEGTYESVAELIATGRTIDIVVYGKQIESSELAHLIANQSHVLDLRQAFQNILHRIPVVLMNDTLALRIVENRDTDLYEFLVRGIEIILALCILVLTSPLLLLAAIAIRIEDSRSIFYKQERVGRHGKRFSIIKLQSMYTNAEKNGAQWATHNDSRITPVGKILRITHIDEIPQMWNVLKGDIALVGPRPERPEFVEKLDKEIPYYFLRHTIKPGFTGWAQIKFRYARSVMDSQEKFEYDLYYVKNRNFFLDIGIILKTIQIVFTHGV
jgi:exopolysaccharide biosynthesis polyprenyl glycosylphosphotransferase